MYHFTNRLAIFFESQVYYSVLVMVAFQLVLWLIKTLISVSYTHLDVYKRQHICYIPFQCSIFIFFFLSKTKPKSSLIFHLNIYYKDLLFYYIITCVTRICFLIDILHWMCQYFTPVGECGITMHKYLFCIQMLWFNTQVTMHDMKQ